MIDKQNGAGDARFNHDQGASLEGREKKRELARFGGPLSKKTSLVIFSSYHRPPCAPLLLLAQTPMQASLRTTGRLPTAAVTPRAKAARRAGSLAPPAAGPPEVREKRKRGKEGGRGPHARPWMGVGVAAVHPATLSSACGPAWAHDARVRGGAEGGCQARRTHARFVAPPPAARGRR